MMSLRPVARRASFIALSTASAPELVKKTWSSDGGMIETSAAAA